MQEKDKETKKENLLTAVFAGGCFWCMESAFEKLPGVYDAISGYMGGAESNPTYQDYAKKGHIEVVRVDYDPTITSYQKLLTTFWQNIDPTDPNGQFADRGPQYRPAIFYSNEQQKKAAEESKRELNESKRFDTSITVEIVPESQFYEAEDYHQGYHTKHPFKYNFFYWRSGRGPFIEKHWNNKESKNPDGYQKPSKEALKKMLTPLQYKVTQEEGTEPAFNNEYWDNKQPGIYVDIVSGEPLFSSKDKYQSGTGWPSFIRPLEPDNIIEKEDRSLFGTRTEVKSKKGDSHLGHVFEDGPEPTGLRYCLNSAALKFIPADQLEEKGYGRYKELFKKNES